MLCDLEELTYAEAADRLGSSGGNGPIANRCAGGRFWSGNSRIPGTEGSDFFEVFCMT